MTRREYIEMMLKAGVLYALPFAGFISSCETATDRRGQFLNTEDFAFLECITESIIPQTNTIGAKEAGVPHFIDLYLQNCMDETSQKEYLKNLVSYRKYLSELNIDFDKPNERLTNQLVMNEKNKEKTDKKILDFIKSTKTLTLKGYFTNKVAIEQNLLYLPVPKEYKACINFSEVGKVWVN
jgi:hypothetical protein